MTVRQHATYGGVDRSLVRPGSVIDERTVSQTCEDQAYLYERINGVKVPTSSSIVATPHKHSGTDDGPVIPIPLLHAHVDATFDPLPGVTWVGLPSVRVPFVKVPIFVPAGVTKGLVVVVANGPHTLKDCRVDTYQRTSETAFAHLGSWEPIEQPGSPWSAGLGGSVVAGIAKVTLSPGVINLVYVRMLDGAQVNGVLYGRRVEDVLVLPLREAPSSIPAWQPPVASDAARHDEDEFTPVHVEVSDPDKALSSWLLTTMARNDQVLIESATGWSAAGASTTTAIEAGHNHAGGAVADGLSGAGMDQQLGAYHFGVSRMRFDDGTTGAWQRWDHIPDIVASPTYDADDNWQGNIYGISVDYRAASTVTVTTLRVRVPQQTDANLGVHSASANKVKICVLHTPQPLDNGGDTAMQINAQCRDSTGATGSAASANVWTGFGNEAGGVKASIVALQLPSTISGGGDDLLVDISVTVTSPDNADDQAAIVLHGACIYYED